MSKAIDSITTTRQSATRGNAYLINLPATHSGGAHWPHAKGEARAFTPKKPVPTSFVGVEPFSDQIRAVLINYHRFIGLTPSRSSLNKRVEVLAVFYKTLHANGFDIQDVSSFSLRHAKALLDIWQAKGKASNTIYTQWSVLRAWSRVLGKHGMVGPINGYQAGFNRLEESPSGYSALKKDELQTRSAFLSTKPDLTPYLVDRLNRELDITREMALELDIEAVREVVEREATVLRVGEGKLRRNILHIRLHLDLMVEVRDFMVSRNRKTLAWTGLDLDAAIQKYSLRMAYVNRTIFPKDKAATPKQKEGGAA